jgi:hypothetical protein
MIEEARITEEYSSRKCAFRILESEMSVEVILFHSDELFRRALISLDMENYVVYYVMHERMMEAIRSM